MNESIDVQESVLDALSHWPFIYKVQYSIMERPPMDRIRSTIVDEFPVSYLSFHVNYSLLQGMEKERERGGFQSAPKEMERRSIKQSAVREKRERRDEEREREGGE